MQNKRDGMTLELTLTSPTGGGSGGMPRQAPPETLFASHKVDEAGDVLGGLALTQVRAPRFHCISLLSPYNKRTGSKICFTWAKSVVQDPISCLACGSITPL